MFVRVLPVLLFFTPSGLRPADLSSKGTLDNFLKQAGYQVIEFKLNAENKALVQGDLGAGKRLTFALDTGWSMTTVNSRSTTGIKTFGELNVIMDDPVLGHLNDPSILILQNLSLGGSRFVNQPAVSQVLQFDYVSIPFEGVIGSDFFFRNHCILDFLTRKLYVRGKVPNAEDANAIESTFRNSHMIEVPAQIDTNKLGILLIDSVINGKSAKLLVDTGCNISVLDNSQIERLGLEVVRDSSPPKGSLIPREITGHAVGVGEIGMHEIRVVKVQSLQLGSVKWEKVHFAAGNLTYWGLSQSDESKIAVQGLFGIDELTRHGVLIDYSTRKLWFRPTIVKH